MEEFTTRLDSKHISIYENNAGNIDIDNATAAIQWYWDVEIRSWGVKGQIIGVYEVTVEYDRVNIDTNATEPVIQKFDNVEVDTPVDWSSAISPQHITIDNGKCTVDF